MQAKLRQTVALFPGVHSGHPNVIVSGGYAVQNGFLPFCRSGGIVRSPISRQNRKRPTRGRFLFWRRKRDSLGTHPCASPSGRLRRADRLSCRSVEPLGFSSSPLLHKNKKTTPRSGWSFIFGGERGIRTLDGS